MARVSGVCAGNYNKWVTLARSPQTSGDADGFWEPLSPSGTWASLMPQNASTNGELRTIEYTVRMRHHAQISVDTKLTYDDGTTTHELFVRGIQNVNVDDIELVLFCEEILG